MTAIIVSDYDINIIATFGERYHVLNFRGVSMTGEEIASALHSANVDSINYRYNKNNPVNYTGRYKAVIVNYKPMDVVRLCDYLYYQSCEDPSYPTSLAKKILDRIRGDAFQEIPEFQVANHP